MKTTPQAKKSLGQHFLSDPNTCRKIARFARVVSRDQVVEIGPGTGQLTEALLTAAGAVTAVEFDRDMIDFLRDRFSEEVAAGRLHLVQADVLTVDWDAILSPHPVKVIGNLPYNISTQLLTRMGQQADRFHSLTVMVQKEVAERILAAPGSRDFGVLTLLVECRFRRQAGFDVPPEVFIPRPRVTSRLIRLFPRTDAPAPVEGGRFVELVKQSFAHRRKTLFNNLKKHHDPARLRTAFSEAGLDPVTRPEAVGLEQYLALSRVL